MKWSFSSNAYLGYTVEQAFRKIAELGYRGVELLADVPHAWPAGLLESQRQAIRAAMVRNNLTIANVNAFMMNAIADPRQPYWHPSWIEPDANYRAIRREHSIRAVVLAQELGVANVSVEPGGPLPRGWTWRQGMDLFYEELMPCVAVAEARDIDLLIEPEPGLLIETFEQYQQLAARVNSPRLGLNFDIGHAYCMNQDPAEWIEVMASHTKHYHIEDIAATREHHHLVPGDGAIDFHAVLAAIKRTDYQGWITVELYPYGNDPDTAARRAWDFLLDVEKKVGQDLSLGLPTN